MVCPNFHSQQWHLLQHFSERYIDLLISRTSDAIRYLSAHDNSYIRYFRGHTAAVTTIALSPSSDAFLSASHDDTVRLWDLRSSSAQGILHLHAPHLAIYDPTATVIAIASPSAQEILLYDARNYDKPPFATFDLLEQENTMRPFSGNAGGPSPPGDWTKLEFSNDGRSLLVTTNGAAHYVLDAFDGRLVAYLLRPAGPTNRISPSSIPSLRASKQTTATGGRATGQGDACFSPDGRFVLSGTASAGSICVWDLDGLEAGEAGAEKVLRPLCELGGELDGNGRKEVGVASVLAYSPRHNLVVGADRGVVFWLPEVD